MGKINLKPLSESVGAEILSINLTDLRATEFKEIRSALDTYGGLLFRNQELSPENLVVFSKMFGDLDHAPQMENGKTAVEGFPEIYIVSNILDDNDKPIGSLGAGEAVWHTDMSYLPNPPDFSMLYAIEVPAKGGDTSLCGMAAAYDALPKDLRDSIQKKAIKHDGTYNSGGFLRKGLREDNDPMTCEGQPHPIVCAHPRNGRPVLYLGRRKNAYVVGLEREDSESLLDSLWEFSAHSENSYTQQWRVGDLLLWDNRSTMHRRDPFDSTARRLMQRTQIRGASPPASY
ncbi:MAG: TauD/TfdA family dioxygenase [Pseudomonadota bacterium]|nr:TauD/TfdA family dioxygenase [Pseudomonadota bacterium]